MGWLILSGVVVIYLLVVFRVIKLSVDVWIYIAGGILILGILSYLAGQGEPPCVETKAYSTC